MTIGVAALLGASGIADASTGATLRIATMRPLVVRGAHFRAHEQVRVVLTARDVQMTRRVRTTSGTFTASFGNVALGRCSAFTVRAVGSRGDSATLKHVPLPACMPA